MDPVGSHMRRDSIIVANTGGQYLLSRSISSLETLLQTRVAFTGDGSQPVISNYSLWCLGLSTLSIDLSNPIGVSVSVSEFLLEWSLIFG